MRVTTSPGHRPDAASHPCPLASEMTAFNRLLTIMLMSGLLRWTVLLGILLAMAASGFGQDETSDLKFKVLKDYNGKPIRNASVVLHPVNHHGRQERGGFELKTDENGVTAFPGVPYGVLRIQVLVQGYQTFGEDYNINQPSMEITVRLKRPSGQYSVYPGEGQAKPDAPKDPNKDPSPDAQKPR